MTRPAALTVLAAVLAAAAVGELGWRLARVRFPALGAAPIGYAFDPVVGWKLAPDQRLRHRGADFDVTVVTDGAGNRVGCAAASGSRPRAVFLGDSLTFGWGVEADDTFACELAAELGMEAVNLGVPGYAPDQSLLRWRQAGRPLRPALVVLTLCGNDEQEILAGRIYGRAKPRLRLGSRGLEVSPAAVRTSLLDRSVLQRSLASWLAARRGPRLTAERRPEARRLIAAAVTELAAEVAASGSRLVVVEPLPGLAGEPGAETLLVPLPAALTAAGGAAAVHFHGDPHWNRRGHHLVAASIHAALTGARPVAPAVRPGRAGEGRDA